jgi:protease PrsW
MWIIFLSMLPCLFWLVFFYVQDRYGREPLWLVASTFVLGIFSTIPALICNTVGMVAIALLFGSSTFSQFAFFFGVVGPIEEGVKLLAVLIFAYKQPQFNEPIDGVIYSAAAALGFAAAENVLYVSQFQNIELLALRGPLANAGHALFSACWGLALSRAKATSNIRGNRARLILLGWLAAASVHGLYDFILTLMGDQPFYIAITPAIILTGCMFIYVEYKVIGFVKSSPNKPTTGKLVITLRCPACGELGKARTICRKCRARLPEMDMGELRHCHRCNGLSSPGAVGCAHCHYSLLYNSTSAPATIYPHLLKLGSEGQEEIVCVLDKHTIAIGKTLDNEFVIESDDSISNRHARIVWNPRGIHVVQDLNSTNGTFVNGLRVQEGYLQNGYELRLGQSRYIYRAVQLM